VEGLLGFGDAKIAAFNVFHNFLSINSFATTVKLSNAAAALARNIKSSVVLAGGQTATAIEVLITTSTRFGI
jgi:hypothetical protein